MLFEAKEKLIKNHRGLFHLEGVTSHIVYQQQKSYGLDFGLQ